MEDTWEMTGTLTDGKLVYENGSFESTEYDEYGEGWTLDFGWEESGYFYLNEAWELNWHDDNTERSGGEDSAFVK